jgi:hypothetical protein
MLALYKNVSILWKCWHFYEMSVHYWNVCVLLKCCRFIEMPAHYWNVGVLWKCALYWNVGAKLKYRHTIEMLEFYENVGTLYNSTCKNLYQLYKLTFPLLFGLANLRKDCSPLLSLVALHKSRRCSSLHVLLLGTSYHMPASLYVRTAPIPARLGWTCQMLAFYSNVGSLLKCRCPIENHWKWAVYSYAARRHIKNW